METPQPIYCQPEDVYQAIGLVDSYTGQVEGPSDADIISYEQVCRLILATEDEIDHMTRWSWRPHQIKNKILDLNRYWHDIDGLPLENRLRGGYPIYLHPDICPWDTTLGDKLEERKGNGNWSDVSDLITATDASDAQEVKKYWLDPERGVLYTKGINQYVFDSVRITYRYGSAETVPYDIQLATAYLTAVKFLNSQLYMTRLGTSGDLGNDINALKKDLTDQANRLIALNRHAGKARSLLE